MRQTLRALRNSPGYTITTLLTLAIAIGANTAWFSIVDSVLLRPLPYPLPDRLIAIWDSYPPQFARIGASGVEVDAWREQHDLFADLARYRHVPQELNLTGGAEPIRVRVTYADSALFRVLGLRTSQGRAFLPAEDSPGAHPVAIVSEKLWRSYYGANPRTVGAVMRLNDTSYTIAGVLPAPLYPAWADVWLPLGQLGDEATNPVRHGAGVVARLHAGVSLTQVNARLRDLSQRLAQDHSATSRGFSAGAVSLSDDAVRDVRPVLRLLFLAVAFILLVAIANIANLQLARGLARRTERAVRLALGASPGRLALGILGESLLLSAAGAALGWLVALWFSDVVRGLPFAPAESHLDARALAFTCAIALAAGLLAGLAPVCATFREDLRAELGGAARSMTGGPRGAAVRSGLIVAEFALAMVLLMSAALLLTSLARLLHVDPGFRTANLLSLRVSLSPAAYPDTASVETLYRRLDAGMKELPGVQSMAVSNALPLAADRLRTASRFAVPGSPAMRPEAYPLAEIRTASPDLFRVLGVPLRAGRFFAAEDGNQPYVIVNESMARTFWPGQSAIGKRFITGLWGATQTWSTVIGVVGDVKQFGLDSESSYELYFQSDYPTYVFVRTAGDPNSIANAARRLIQRIDPAIPVTDVRSMEDVLNQSTTSRRFLTMALTGFAAVALALAIVGIYGLLSFWVTQNRREIGIRMALGADGAVVLRAVLGRALGLAAAGLAIGVAASFASGRVLAGLLYQVGAHDPVVMLSVGILMIGVTAAACLAPALRATRVDPVLALRSE